MSTIRRPSELEGISDQQIIDGICTYFSNNPNMDLENLRAYLESLRHNASGAELILDVYYNAIGKMLEQRAQTAEEEHGIKRDPEGFAAAAFLVGAFIGIEIAMAGVGVNGWKA